MKTLRLATRKSPLALAQSRWVAAQLKAHWPNLSIEMLPVHTAGDRIVDRPLAQVGGKGLFVSEVQALLHQGQAELAVHSLKDLPGDHERDDRLEIACLPPRATAVDVLVTPTGMALDDLDAGMAIGTSSMRRVTQLRSQRPDLAYQPLRGNVGTRLAQLHSGKLDGIVLAAAGLARLALLERTAHHPLSIEWMIPAVGQGTLALEIRHGDRDTKALLAPLHDVATALVTAAERSFLATLEGNCHVPVAGHARLHPQSRHLQFEGLVAAPFGERRLRGGADRFLPEHAPDALSAAAAVGHEVGQALLAQGARALIVAAEIEACKPAALSPVKKPPPRPN